MHIMLVRFSSMGDVVIQTSLVEFLKKNIPQLEITFVTQKLNRVFLDNHPHIDRTLYYEKKSGQKDLNQLLKLISDIKKTNPDLIIDLHNTLRSKVMRLLTPSLPHMVVNKRSFWRKLLVLTKKDFLAKQSPQHLRIREDFSRIFNLDVFNDSDKLTRISADFDQILTQKKPILVIAPVASFKTKIWPMEHYEQLIKLLRSDSYFSQYKIEIIAGPEDRYCSELGQAYSDELVQNRQGQLSLHETCSLIASARLLIGNDTGMNHIAESFHIPTITLFGSTSPSFGFRPHLVHSDYMYKNISCSPCSVTGSKPCHRPTHECMLAIKPEEVHHKIKSILEVQNA
ncbi:MAG: hypothetical protein CME62_12745 [Halobacteriovoraceae bacterium]|nr:hypothetical protein [Halobacteriovoraceae bacterium]|tara:strand:- start:7610 stop:8635 length:1026 start_codon:yes stop_codon:yes gene_type:complete